MSNRIGFWSVLALVVGSQIGSGVFMLPANLAAFGTYSIMGWIISGIGAISLALVFANLCSKFPKTGGPHVYIEQIFGKNVAFFSGWTYWVVSWISTSAVIIAAIGYLSPFIGEQSSMVYLSLELLLLLLMCGLNLLGVSVAGRAEAVFTILKFIPLFIVPVVAIVFFDGANFYTSSMVAEQSVATNLAQVVLLTLWGFVGLESATTPAGSVENPEKTIPRAIVIGTSIVALIYIFNNVAIMGLISGDELQFSKAPYVDVAQHLFGGRWHLAISMVASIVCIGTLNAWILAASQISLGLAEDKFMPNIFAKRNRLGAPYASIIVSCLGIVPLLILTSNKSIAGQVALVIEFAVTSFLFVYLLCSVANLAVSLQQRKLQILTVSNSIVAIIFCAWVISETQIHNLLISSLFTISGIPIYLFWYKKQK